MRHADERPRVFSTAWSEANPARGIARPAGRSTAQVRGFVGSRDRHLGRVGGWPRRQHLASASSGTYYVVVSLCVIGNFD